MDTPPRPLRRAPRTFEMRDAEWIETTPAAGRGVRRAPLWVLVPVVMVALAGVLLLLFVAIVALLTGGVANVRQRVGERAAGLRERLRTLLRGRRGGVPMPSDGDPGR